MTRDHRRKKAVRAHAAATGRTYLDAASSLRGSRSGTVVLATQLRDDLVAALKVAGWPVVIENHPQHQALCAYAGPAVVHVSRKAEPARAWTATGDEHPDDPEMFDLDTPLQVTVWAPVTTEYSEELERVLGVDAHEIPGDRSVAEIVAEIVRVIAEARQRDHADTLTNAECGICGDRYPADGLFQPTRTQVDVCPCCAFDGDLLGPRPAQLAFHLDRAASQNLAVPAGWAAVQVLLCCLGGPELPTRLQEDWRASGTLYTPMEWWADPLQTWVWLPVPERRPAALADLGCGASLAHIIAAIDWAHPDLRAAWRSRLDDDEESDEFPVGEVPDATFERIWPAAVAYAIAMLTQQAERPNHRSPWHVLESFELSDWVDALAPDLGGYHVEAVLYGSILTIRGALDPSEPE